MEKHLCTALLVFITIPSFCQINALFGLYVKKLKINQKEVQFYADLYWWIETPKCRQYVSERIFQH